MPAETVTEQVKGIVAKQLGLNPITLWAEVILADIGVKDEIESAMIITDIEDAFHIKINHDEEKSIKTVGDLIRLVENKSK